MCGPSHPEPENWAIGCCWFVRLVADFKCLVSRKLAGVYRGDRMRFKKSVELKVNDIQYLAPSLRRQERIGSRMARGAPC